MRAKGIQYILARLCMRFHNRLTASGHDEQQSITVRVQTHIKQRVLITCNKIFSFYSGHFNRCRLQLVAQFNKYRFTRSLLQTFGQLFFCDPMAQIWSLLFLQNFKFTASVLYGQNLSLNGVICIDLTDMDSLVVASSNCEYV